MRKYYELFSSIIEITVYIIIYIGGVLIFADGIENVRYGFIDRESNFTINYEFSESDSTVFSGLYKNYTNE